MSRLLMLIVLMLSASGARAEWTAIGGNDEQGITVYMDFATIRRSGNLVKVWELYDFKTVHTIPGIRYQSGKAQRQYDCQEEQYRFLAGSYFSKNMGKGDVAPSYGDSPLWEPVEPDSISEQIFKILCDKKREAEAAAQPAQQKLIDDWKVRIRAKIKGRVVIPANIEGNPQAVFAVVLLPGGEVLSATLKKSSGNAAYDVAVERAIMTAQPLPVPTDTNLFQENFQELTLVFRPKD